LSLVAGRSRISAPERAENVTIDQPAGLIRIARKRRLDQGAQILRFRNQIDTTFDKRRVAKATTLRIEPVLKLDQTWRAACRHQREVKIAASLVPFNGNAYLIVTRLRAKARIGMECRKYCPLPAQIAVL